MLFWGAGLTLKKRGADRLILSPSPAFRVLFGIFFAAVLAALLWEPGASSPRLAPIIFAAILGIGLLYNDSWVFDRRQRTAEGRLGLLFLFRRRRLALSELTAIRVEAAGRMSRLVAVTARGLPVVLDSARSTRAAALKETGRRIAAFCGLPD